MTLVCPLVCRRARRRGALLPGLRAAARPAGGPAEAVLDERGERMRKSRSSTPRASSSARSRQQPEAEFIQSLLLEEGVPSTLRRTRGFDVPRDARRGPRDVLVPASGATAAREVLLRPS